MAYKVIWSREAELDLNNLLLYLYTEWSEQVVDRFLTNLNHQLSNISQMPLASKYYPDTLKVRSVLITPQVRLYYSVGANFIDLLNLYDTRQDPNKAPF